ncbi:FAD-binding oxidoreductase [Paenibacillus piri]|nr:FAD-binding oxidoreductase [Paenibacillus piri]
MDGTETAFPVQQALIQIRENVGPGLTDAISVEASGSPYKIQTALTVYPENEEQTAKLVRLAAANDYGIVPQGGATKDAQGGVTGKADLLVSMKKMSGILHHSVSDLMVTALPGTTVAELQQALRREGQFLPIDPAWGEQSTIGGMIASNGSGPKRALYGSARDHLIASRVVLADGSVIRTGAKVVKNVAGYDMNKLFVGSMGTIGILTELTFKIRPLPVSSGMLVYCPGNGGAIRQLHETLLDSQLEPCAAELISSAVAGELFGKAEPALAILFEDVEASVSYQLEWVKSYAAGMGLKPLAELRGFEATEPVVERLRAVTPNSNEMPSGRLAAALKLLSSLTDVPGISELAAASAERAGLQLQFSGGLYTGISHAAVYGDWWQLEDVVQWMKQMYASLGELNGTAVAAFAPKQVRSSVASWGTERSDHGLMQGIKQQFDAANLFNRGRFVGGI